MTTSVFISSSGWKTIKRTAFGKPWGICTCFTHTSALAPSPFKKQHLPVGLILKNPFLSTTITQGKWSRRPIKSLILNDTPYIKRGWTQAELLWSSSRAQMLFIPELNLSISGCTTDAELLDGEASNAAQRAEVPVTPEIFKQRTEELVFTHRVDLDPGHQTSSQGAWDISKFEQFQDV